MFPRPQRPRLPAPEAQRRWQFSLFKCAGLLVQSVSSPKATSACAARPFRVNVRESDGKEFQRLGVSGFLKIPLTKNHGGIKLAHSAGKF